MILTDLMTRLEQYYWKPKMIPSLNLANGSERQQRSERREGCLRTLAAMLKYLDLATLKVGVPQPNGEFQNFTVPFLASHAGLSLWRTQRAIKDLKRAGLISLTSICEPDGEGGYRGLAAVKAVKEELFAIFGLVKRLKHERDRASKRLKKKREAFQGSDNRKGNLGDLARLKSMIQGFFDEKPKKRSSSPTGATESVAVQEQRARAARLRQLTEERPDLTTEQILSILKSEA
ncbi:hypothetical protein [Microbulbifer aggregans]|uniref:hypothetical protein n=1 Tax=Microbulbifer aggregans TaxID=1769779 RepID=UPI001CFDD8CE|nr:hypothetical protein [Microbulbifer aggregans]